MAAHPKQFQQPDSCQYKIPSLSFKASELGRICSNQNEMEYILASNIRAAVENCTIYSTFLPNISSGQAPRAPQGSPITHISILTVVLRRLGSEIDLITVIIKN